MYRVFHPDLVAACRQRWHSALARTRGAWQAIPRSRQDVQQLWDALPRDGAALRALWQRARDRSGQPAQLWHVWLGAAAGVSAGCLVLTHGKETATTPAKSVEHELQQLGRWLPWRPLSFFLVSSGLPARQDDAEYAVALLRCLVAMKQGGMFSEAIEARVHRVLSRHVQTCEGGGLFIQRKCRFPRLVVGKRTWAGPDDICDLERHPRLYSRKFLKLAILAASSPRVHTDRELVGLVKQLMSGPTRPTGYTGPMGFAG